MCIMTFFGEILDSGSINGDTPAYFLRSLINLAVFFVFYFVPEFHLVQHHMFMNSLLNIVLRGSASLMLFTTLAYLFKISPDCSHLIQTILSAKIFKGGYKMSEL